MIWIKWTRGPALACAFALAGCQGTNPLYDPDASVSGSDSSNSGDTSDGTDSSGPSSTAPTATNPTGSTSVPGTATETDPGTTQLDTGETYSSSTGTTEGLEENRRKLKLTVYNPDEIPISGLPIVAKLHGDEFDFGAFLDGGSEATFVLETPDDELVIPHNFEIIDPDEEIVFVWFELPALLPFLPQDVYMYYGPGTEHEDPQFPLWSVYTRVHHFADAYDNELEGGADLVPTPGVDFIDSWIGPGASLPESEHIAYGLLGNVTSESGQVSFLFKANEDIQGDVPLPMLVAIEAEGNMINALLSIELNKDPNSQVVFLSMYADNFLDQKNVPRSASAGLDPNVANGWHHVLVHWKPFELVVDGIPATAFGEHPDEFPVTHVFLGDADLDDNYSFAGIMDEYRFSPVALPPVHRTAEMASMLFPEQFVQIGGDFQAD